LKPWKGLTWRVFRRVWHFGDKESKKMMILGSEKGQIEGG